MEDYRIYLVPFSHLDLGWTYYAGRNFRKILEKHAHIAAGYVANIESRKEFRFTGLGTFANFAWLAVTEKDLLDRIRSLVSEGRLDLPGHLLNMPNLGGAEFHLTPESLIRNLVEGRRIHQEFLGRSDSPVLHIPDVTGSFGNLPQLLRLAGYDSYRFDRGWHSESPRHTFIWEGIDGTRVLACRTAYTGNIADPGDTEAMEKLHHMLAQQAEIEQEVPVLHHHGHDLTEADDNDVAFCSQWNHQFPGLAMRLSTYREFFEAVRRCEDKLPVYRGTIDPLGWTAAQGMNGSAERALFGGLFDTIQAAEVACVLSANPYPEQALKRCWFTGLCFQEHGATNFLLPEDSKQVKADLKRVTEEARILRDRALANRAAQLRSDTVHGEPVVVFNSLPWKRHEPVELTLSFAPTDLVTTIDLLDADSREVEFQPLSASYYPHGGLRELRILWIADVPPSGEALYGVAIRRDKQLELPGPRELNEWDIIENDRIRAPMHFGFLRELTDLNGNYFCRGGMTEQHGESITTALGAITVQQAKAPDIQYNWAIMNQFGKPITLGSFPFRIDELESGPLRKTVRVSRDIDGEPLIWRYSVVKGVPALDIEIELATQRSGYRWRMSMPFIGLEPQWWRDEPFGMHQFDPDAYTYEEVGEAMIPGGFFCQSFVDVRFGKSGRGVTVLAPNHPPYVAENAVLEAVLLNTAPLRFEDRTCRFVMSPETRSLGTFRFKYRLWTYNDRAQHSPQRRALEMRFPLQAFRVEAASSGRDCCSQLEVEPANIVWSALYRDKNQTLLRLYECDGAKTTAKITFPEKKYLTPADIQGNAIEAQIKEKDGIFSVPFNPFQIRTFAIT